MISVAQLYVILHSRQVTPKKYYKNYKYHKNNHIKEFIAKI